MQTLRSKAGSRAQEPASAADRCFPESGSAAPLQAAHHERGGRAPSRRVERASALLTGAGGEGGGGPREAALRCWAPVGRKRPGREENRSFRLPPPQSGGLFPGNGHIWTAPTPGPRQEPPLLKDCGGRPVPRAGWPPRLPSPAARPLPV